MDSIPDRDIPKSLKSYELLLARQSDLRGRARIGRPSVRIMWLGVVCHVSGACTSVKQHYKREQLIELPVANRHRRDMTEKNVESAVKPEQTTATCTWAFGLNEVAWFESPFALWMMVMIMMMMMIKIPQMAIFQQGASWKPIRLHILFKGTESCH